MAGIASRLMRAFTFRIFRHHNVLSTPRRLLALASAAPSRFPPSYVQVLSKAICRLPLESHSFKPILPLESHHSFNPFLDSWTRRSFFQRIRELDSHSFQHILNQFLSMPSVKSFLLSSLLTLSPAVVSAQSACPGGYYALAASAVAGYSPAALSYCSSKYPVATETGTATATSTVTTTIATSTVTSIVATTISTYDVKHPNGRSRLTVVTESPHLQPRPRSLPRPRPMPRQTVPRTQPRQQILRL